jgi:hypothetical protein
MQIMAHQIVMIETLAQHDMSQVREMATARRHNCTGTMGGRVKSSNRFSEMCVTFVVTAYSVEY